MKNFNLEEFKDIIEKYNAYKAWLQDFILENKDLFAAVQSKVKELNYESIITNIEINNNKFNITAMNDYGYDEFGIINIELPLECLTNKDDFEKEYMLYLKLKQKFGSKE